MTIKDAIQLLSSLPQNGVITGIKFNGDYLNVSYIYVAASAEEARENFLAKKD